jgi:uncharacterized protein YcbX
MALIGRLSCLVTYPVKSMAGQSIMQGELLANGLADDRLYAFESDGAPPGMLRLTGGERRAMLRYHAQLNEAGAVQVSSPEGLVFEVESQSLLSHFLENIPGATKIFLTHALDPQTDVRPLSLISMQTIRRLSEALHLKASLDPRRFRANLYLDLDEGAFAEDGIVGRAVQIGRSATIRIRDRDPRCRFITYDPGEPLLHEPLFTLMKVLDRCHEGRAGVYASIIEPGTVAVGDQILLL